MNKPKRVAHLSSVHVPGDTRVYYRFCKSLAEKGFEVHLVIREVEDELREGIHVHPFPILKPKYVRVLLAPILMFFKALALRADLYQFHDSELIPCGLALRLFGKKVIYDVHEDTPKTILAKDWIPAGFRKGVASVLSQIERGASHLFSHVFVATESIAENFEPGAITIVHNYPLLNQILTNIDMIDKINVLPGDACYVGLMEDGRGWKQLLEALSLMPHNMNFRLHIVGKNISSELAENYQVESFIVEYGQRDRKFVYSLMQQASFGLVLFLPEPNHIESLPNKLFEYMSAGIPFIASDFPLWRELADGCALFVDPESPQQIRDAMLWFIAHPEEAKKMGQKGQQMVFQKYNWEPELDKVTHVYTKLLA